MTPARLLQRVFALIFGVLGFASIVHAAAAGAWLTGEVRINTPVGEPASGVEISAVGANPQLTDSSGRFKLQLGGRRPGDVVTLKVTKPGWQVVNSEVIEQPLVLAADPARIPMVVIISLAAKRDDYARQLAQRRGRPRRAGSCRSCILSSWIMAPAASGPITCVPSNCWSNGAKKRSARDEGGAAE